MRPRHRARQLELDLADAPEVETVDDEAFPPGPNYLSRFRRALGHEGITDQDAAAFQQAVAEWLAEVTQEDQQR